MQKFEIYTLVGCPVLGDLGPRTLIKNRIICPDCNREVAIEYHKIEYVFDQWKDGLDLVTARMVYIVTNRLRMAIESNKLCGVQFRKIWSAKSNRFLEIYGKKRLPTFYEMIASNIIDGEGWWENVGLCKTCGQPKWNTTPKVLEWASARVTGTITAPRSVYEDSWKGQDVFYLPEPGPPIVTQRFVDTIENLGTIDVMLHSAKWVSRP